MSIYDVIIKNGTIVTSEEIFTGSIGNKKWKNLGDFRLWGGLVPENISGLEELIECGVIGFKAFCHQVA